MSGRTEKLFPYIFGSKNLAGLDCLLKKWLFFVCWLRFWCSVGLSFVSRNCASIWNNFKSFESLRHSTTPTPSSKGTRHKAVNPNWLNDMDWYGTRDTANSSVQPDKYIHITFSTIYHTRQCLYINWTKTLRSNLDMARKHKFLKHSWHLMLHSLPRPVLPSQSESSDQSKRWRGKFWVPNHRS